MERCSIYLPAVKGKGFEDFVSMGIPFWQLIVHTSLYIYVNIYLTDLKMLSVKGWRFVPYVRVHSRQMFQTVTSRSMSLAMLVVSVHSVIISWITAPMRISNATSTNILINDTIVTSLMIQLNSDLNLWRYQKIV